LVSVSLEAEKAKDGKIYVYFMDGTLAQYRVCIAIIKGDYVKWTPEGSDIQRIAII